MRRTSCCKPPCGPDQTVETVKTATLKVDDESAGIILGVDDTVEQCLVTAFEVEIERVEGRLFGLYLDLIDGEFCMVTRIEKGGLIDMWNQNCLSTHVVRAQSRLVSVGDRTGTAPALVRLLQTDAQRVKLIFSNPVELNVTLQRNGRGLGVEINRGSNTLGLVIDAVTDGVLSEWNSANPSRKVRPHDRIISVNGLFTTGLELLTIMEESDDLQLKILSWR